MNEFSISAILCAAGSSDRMGAENKLLLPFGESTIFNHVLSQVLKSNVDEVILVLGHQYDDMVKSLPVMPKHVKIVENIDYITGHTSSIQEGLRAKDDQIGHFMICLGDMPLIRSEHYRSIIEFHKSQSLMNDRVISRPMVDKIPGHPVLMDIHFKSELLDCSDKEGCRQVIKNNLQYLRPFETTDDSYIIDADTPDAYKALFNKN